MVLAAWPCLKTIIVGIDMTPYWAAVCWFSSTLSFTMRRSPRSPAISSSTGATTRHGPHHGAQKSTRTGCSDSSTSAWKFASVTFWRSLIPSLYEVKRTEQRRRQVHLGDRCDRHHGERQRGRREGRGEQLIPRAHARGDEPRGEREEERDEL